MIRNTGYSICDTWFTILDSQQSILERISDPELFWLFICDSFLEKNNSSFKSMFWLATRKAAKRNGRSAPSLIISYSMIPSRRIICDCSNDKTPSLKQSQSSKCTEKRLQPFQPSAHGHPALKWRPWRIFHARKPALPTISLRVWKAKIREEVRPLDMC